MQVTKNSVVTFHYTLSAVAEAGGEDVEVETSRAGDPVLALHGHGNVMPGLEKALGGRAAGERFEAIVAPAEGYGPKHADSMQRVSKKYFDKGVRLRPGLVTRLNTDDGMQSVTVVKVGSKFVDVDTNHPLAGKTLKFDLEVVDVRDATPEELAHGHAHGPHGHH